MAYPYDDDEVENLITGDRSTMPEEDESDPLSGMPSPSKTLAGPQTRSDQVAQRIAAVRAGGSEPNPPPSNSSGFDLGPRPDAADPSQLAAAQEFAKKNALTAGLGRSLNALSAGTGFKPDNSGADALEKQGAGAVEQAQKQARTQSQLVKDWIAGKSKQAETAENRDFRQKLLAEQIAARRGLAQDKNSAKVDHTSDKAFTDTQAALEQMRGNPAVQQAERDLYSSDKVKSLVKQGGGDPNNLNPQFVKLLVSEVGKIAQGGSPTTHELEGLTPSTLNGALANVWQKFSNSPTPANAGAFIKQYQQYADTVSGDAQKVISDRYGRILGSRKRLLRPEDAQTLEDQYVNRFKPKEAERQDSKEIQSGASFPRQVKNSKTGKVATVSNAQELAEASAEGFQ